MTLHSVRHKFVAAILLTTIAALLISTTAMVIYNLRSYRDNLTHEMITQAVLLGRAIIPALQFDDPNFAKEYLALLEVRPTIHAAAIYTAAGSPFATYFQQGESPNNLPSLPEHDGSRIDGDYVVVFKRIVADNEILGTVYLKVHHQLYEKMLVNMGIAIAVFTLALVVALLLSIWLQASVTRPILAITSLARKVVEERDYSLRADKTTSDEIGYLVDAFNGMLSEVEHRNGDLEDVNKQLMAQIDERIEVERALRDSERNVVQLNTELEQRVKSRTLQLESTNKELEAFSYSVSHDLRAPLRAIDGFSQALLEDYNDQLDGTGRDYLARVRAGAQRMGVLIDDLLKLSTVSRLELNLKEINLSEIATEVSEELRAAHPERHIEFRITSRLTAHCDQRLARIVLQNLLHNASKYTTKVPKAIIEFGMRQINNEAVFFVQDNGAGFDMEYANKLFQAFQRLHDASEFPGTGIGLATVKRIINRHGGRVWAESSVNNGAAFYFTLPTLADQQLP